MSNLAIIVPGVGYHTDKPLLYYAKKIAKAKDYEVIDLSYDLSSVKGNIKDDDGNKEKAFELAYEQTVAALSDVDFTKFDRVVFIGKSIGTVVAAKYDMTYNLAAEHIVLTPVPETFEFLLNCQGLVFHGDADPWCDNELCNERCEELSLTYAVVPGANHSLETGDVQKDIQTIAKVMETIGKVL